MLHAEYQNIRPVDYTKSVQTYWAKQIWISFSSYF